MEIYLIAFFAGLLSFFTVCILPMLAVYISTLTGLSIEDVKQGAGAGLQRKKFFVQTVLFTFGFGVIFTLAGGAASTLGKLIQQYYSQINVLAGVFVTVLALQQLGFCKFNLKFIKGDFKPRGGKNGYLTALTMGVLYALVCSHCIGPALYSMLIFAGTGSMVNPYLLMAVFSLGLAIPYYFVALFLTGTTKILPKIISHQKIVARVSGAILLIFGIILLTGKFQDLVSLFAKFQLFRVPFGM